MMEHSPPRSHAMTSQGNKVSQLCEICSERLTEGQEGMIISECNHVFHSSCIETFLSNSAECPNCKRPCSLSELKKIVMPNMQGPWEKQKSARGKPRGGMAKQHNTRSQSRNLFSESSQNNLIDIDRNVETERRGPSTLLQAQTIENLPQSNQHHTSIETSNIQSSIDHLQINQMIENTVARLLHNVNFPANSNQNSHNHIHLQETPQRRNIPTWTRQNNRSDPQVRTTYNNVSSNSNEGYNSSFDQNFAFKSDKITSIIQNWQIKFDGSAQGISVDEFLYRVRVLTREHFNDDFSLICKNLHILLGGRAREWYWRYHKQVETINWKEFCEALKYQYKDFRSSFDIYEELRNRKMKASETFEMFYEAVSTILDRLDKPIPENELVEILLRNLRPEIRHELLYVPIYSIAHLRKLVQMRENLLSDDYFKRNASYKTTNSSGYRKQIAEVDYSNEPSPNQLSTPTESTVCALKDMRCWNCDQLGHIWEDCVEDRKIFCYGCGEKDTYKPQCHKCAAKRVGSKNFKASNNIRNHP